MIFLGTVATNNVVSKDMFTQALSHELVETISDPTSLNNTCVLPSVYGSSPNRQIADGEQEHNFGYRVNGDLVQAYWSYLDQGAIVPDHPYGSPQQNFTLTETTNVNTAVTLKLTVSGDQLSNQNDAITIGTSADGGVFVNLNGQTASFLPGPVPSGNGGTMYGGIASISVQAGAGQNVIRVANLAANQVVNIVGAGLDIVNIGTGGSSSNVQGILGQVTIDNPPSETAINIQDSGDSTAPTFTLGNDSNLALLGWGDVFDLAIPTLKISYKYTDTGNLTLNSGPGATVDVVATGVTTNLVGAGTSSVKTSWVNIGDGGYVGHPGLVQGILSPLNMSNPTGRDVISVDDSKDGAGPTATLSSITLGSTKWGTITGLSTGVIQYLYAQTVSLTLDTGPATTVHVAATGTATNVIAAGNHTTVTVRAAGSVQGILGTLSLEDPTGLDAIIVDDSADNTARTVTLGTFAYTGDIQNNGDPWGFIPRPGLDRQHQLRVRRHR